MKIIPKNKKSFIDAAVGKIPCDLVIQNANIVNVITGEIYKGDVGIYDGFIAHVHCDPDGLDRQEEKLIAKEYYDAHGDYLIPGLIDAHVHIESSMMTPRNFARVVIPHGTTTVVTDPHEIANVFGIDGVKYMHDSSIGLPMRQYILAPSCVPAVPGKENAGAVFFAEDMTEMIKMERVIGLAEVMDFPGVINNDKRMTDIIDIFEGRNLFIQGHAPFVGGRDLSAYIAAGPSSCHESRTQQEARDKMRSGMYVDARESSISKNVEEIVTATKNFRYLNFLTFCTDDREPEDIIKFGHMNDVLRKAIAAGMHPIDAIRGGSYNIATQIGVKNLGAINPGFTADLLLCSSLEELVPSAVFFEGKLVAMNNELVEEIDEIAFSLEELNSIHVDTLYADDFKIEAPIKSGRISTRIIAYEDYSFSTTNFEILELPVTDGFIDISDYNDLSFVAVINRHKNHDTRTVAIVKKFGTHSGAVGSTVSHDSHNLTIVYDTPENALLVYDKLISQKGGMSCAMDNRVLNSLELSVAGLISTKPCGELSMEVSKMKASLKELGLTEIQNPLLRIVTLALPVIPNAKMSDMGMVDVLAQEIVTMFP